MAEVGNYDLRDSYGETQRSGQDSSFTSAAMPSMLLHAKRVKLMYLSRSSWGSSASLNSTSPYLNVIVAQPH